MRRTKIAPLTRLLVSTTVALTVVGLAGCTLGLPTPSPTPTPSSSPSASAPVDVEPTDPPTTVSALPGSALLRVSVTAKAGDDEVRLELTFNRAQTRENAPEAFEAVQDACPNAIVSQLELYPGLEPTGVITSELEMVGDWPEGLTVAIAAGGNVASFGEGRSVAETLDDPGAFGCTVPVVTGPGSAEFTSLLLGDPAVTDRLDLESQVASGIFGFEADGGSTVEVRWVDCVIQLSSAAQRLANEVGWTQPAEWGGGCLIGSDGTV
jgi:hypothetical protein